MPETARPARSVRRLGCAVAALLACRAQEAPRTVARGEYLAKLMGCPACHSPDPARPYAGGLTSQEPTGPWRSSNLTPHAVTGIGGWTDAQIIAAIRDGVRPDGRVLHPIMPYRYYRRLTDADASALVAFLRSLAPIDHAIAPAPPLSATPSPSGSPTPPPPVAPAPSAVDRGEYLVALMHCSSCHATPGPDGLPDPDRPFAGGKAMRPFGAGLVPVGTGTLIASNITPDRETGIGAWTADDIAHGIRLLVRPDGTVIRGPMQLYAAAWSAIDARDLAAIAAYLKQLPPVRHQVPAAAFQPHGAPARGAP
jgi:mono/diheme cytochrome c family protein